MAPPTDDEDWRPDDKDWTWVLDDQCPECGLTAASVAVASIGDRVRADLPRWVEVLERPGARERPAPTVWSPTEYACHVRDVFVLFAQRIQLMLDQDDPEFANWDQDVTAVEDDYAAQDPAVVSAGWSLPGSRWRTSSTRSPQRCWIGPGVAATGRGSRWRRWRSTSCTTSCTISKTYAASLRPRVAVWCSAR
ncbi:DinB family protein [Aeromicrobium sp. UC242_57]|uniref:DinB family protein n=1 Tax=Aeromicrobium sp. UC242_57 TaxID=3374624 RepID=UPI00378CA79C